MTDFPQDIPVRDNMQTVAFYNLENLFDVNDDKHTNDGDFLPNSAKKWTPKRFENKLKKLGFAISNIGKQETGKHPAIVGLAEVENASVIEDLISSKHLKNCNYDYVHYDSLDERGIDVALLYDTNAFEVITSETFTIQLFDDDGSPDYTRDILLVSGLLDSEKIHVIVNHWSSRREGEKETEHKRMASSNKAGDIIAMLRDDDPDAKIIVIGDFNDEPSSNSIKQLVKSSNLYNPMETLRSYNRGTSNYNRQWNLFDQILFSTNFFKSSKNKFEFSTANIFDEDFLKRFDGKYKGTPFRTYVGKKYKGGYSDHFPVYAIFKK
ncbi:endonuclease/exonuclease/phosphatase family protein [Flavivirga jejuensis]|uniref:Endonuclease n=1 Tax=Flavivirga jejuensis TaxID=870487 RepID=A0ABT8WI12_9FLAO|nr:endonuclease [Flavivirga jejuensis]MDO5972799.1 endonuclease [Flavivirga jejuensis]